MLCGQQKPYIMAIFHQQVLNDGMLARQRVLYNTILKGELN